MTRPRLAIPIIQHFAVRYLIRTGMVNYIREFAHPVILMAWDDPSLRKELEHLGAEVHPLLRFQYGGQFERLHRRVNVLHLRQMRSPSTSIDRRRKLALMGYRDRLIRRARECLMEFEIALPHATERLRKAQDRAYLQDTNARQVEAQLEEIDFDAVFSITPFREEEEPLLRYAKSRELKTCTAILSFDNLTTRGRLPIIFDMYLLWNRYNAAELRRIYPQAHSSLVELVGAPQFDFYYDDAYVWDPFYWRNSLSLPEGRPVLLFGGGFYRVVPHEPHWLKQLDSAIENEELPHKPIILFRCHPVDRIQRWEWVLQNAKNIVMDHPWPAHERHGNTDISRRDIEKLASTLCHSAVHINASSTLTVDGAIFDRPQIGPAYDDRPRRRFDRIAFELYLREHYLPITNSGGLELARNREELVHAVCSALEEPERLKEGRERIVSEICTYNDGNSTHRTVNELRRFLSA